MCKRIGPMWQRRRNRSFREKWIQRGLIFLRFREGVKQFLRRYMEEDGFLRSVLRPIRCEKEE